VLLHGAGADAQLAGNFLVAATLDQQIQYLLISRRDFHSVQVHDVDSPAVSHLFILSVAIRTVGYAPSSPNLRRATSNDVSQSLS
jgi:hypothetical protein